jgi:hypothetical protein
MQNALYFAYAVRVRTNKELLFLFSPPTACINPLN